jgi:hypothetical protein
MIKKALIAVILLITLLFISSCKHVSPPALTDFPPEYKFLRVQGNHIVDMNDKTVILKGLNTTYISVLKQEGHWNEDYFNQMSLWGAKLIRLAVNPGSYRASGKESTLLDIDQAVVWAKKYDMYIMIDWHCIGNPVSGVFQYPEDGTTKAEMKEFWGAVAQRYKKEPCVAFYEIFNEAASMSYAGGGSLSWDTWKNFCDEVIDAIYAENPNAIPVVGGLDWSYNFRDAAGSPMRNKGVAFAAHPYPGHAAQPWEQNWENDFGFMADKYPVILTEFGYDPNDIILPSVYKADDDYGRRILAFAASHGMSWTAFVFYNGAGWPMHLFIDWATYAPTTAGAFFKAKLLEK